MEMQEKYKAASKQQPPLAHWVLPRPGKRLLLLDLDKTLIFYHPSHGLMLRPHLAEFLASAIQHYSIYVFTASDSEYAHAIVNELNAGHGNCIEGVLSRHYCTCVRVERGKRKSVFVKDIRIVTGCHPQDILVVDDLAWSYCLNP